MLRVLQVVRNQSHQGLVSAPSGRRLLLLAALLFVVASLQKHGLRAFFAAGSYVGHAADREAQLARRRLIYDVEAAA